MPEGTARNGLSDAAQHLLERDLPSRGLDDPLRRARPDALPIAAQELGNHRPVNAGPISKLLLSQLLVFENLRQRVCHFGPQWHGATTRVKVPPPLATEVRV